MAKIKILFADDQLPDDDVYYFDEMDSIVEDAIRESLKEKHPDWSPQFIDESVDLYFAVTNLCDAGYNLTTANTCHKAVELIQKSHFDIVIIDLGWSGDKDLPPNQRSYAGWDILDEVYEADQKLKSNKTIPILFSRRFGKNPSIGVRAASKGMLPVVKNYNRASCEALTAAVKFIDTHIINPALEVKESFPLKNNVINDNEFKILFLAADPTNASRLRLGEELREIRQKLQMASKRELFKLHERMSVRPEDLSQALIDIMPQVVHFSGHGNDEGALCFEDKLGKIHPIKPDALAALFNQFATKVKCVVLNACFSDVQARAIVEHIDYVIGMKREIGDNAAIAFTVGFYQAVGAGLSIEEAYNLGCVQILLQGIPENLTPTLVSKKCKEI